MSKRERERRWRKKRATKKYKKLVIDKGRKGQHKSNEY